MANLYQENHNLKQEIRRLRLTIAELHSAHNQELKRLKREILNPKCNIVDIDADWTDAMRTVCQVYDVTPDQVISQTRRQNVCYARHMFCYLCRKELKMTFAGIGYIVKRHHSSIINAVDVYTDLIQYDKLTASHYAKALSLLGDYINQRNIAEHSYSEI